MTGRFGKERLKSLIENHRARDSATPLYRWLLTNCEDISALRSKGDSWAPYVAAAREDGLDLPDEKEAMKRMERYWRRMAGTRRMHPEAEQVPQSPDTESAMQPSRFPRGWRPAVVDDGRVSCAPDGTGVPAQIVPAEENAQVASLPATVPVCSDSETTGEKNFPIGRARAEAIKRDLLARLKRKEPGFHRE
ncbi:MULTISPECIES: hypothetical protein [Komagataeibacter]|uniref:Uncharacterized protein n=1 Tax=Komagataeibacter europaeus NBRC 3261 TaxID=1234669 RepID=A0A0D6Q2V7_KOMEU|nr:MULTISPECIES: hypothetical protein [Komagataeibacter]MCE2566256.1 hypothetical protein [Komagataeibacter sp. FNDCF1]GAN97116.1 hypothetical protein Geu3261_0142_014 [Komagataeibacter europaeus NBRC 3261]